jgi:hypothetical protein
MERVENKDGHGSSYCKLDDNDLGSDTAETVNREGIITVLVGAATFFILPRNPETARFLSADERQSILNGLERDRDFQEEEDTFSWKACLDALKAPQMWFVFIQFFSSGGKWY